MYRVAARKTVDDAYYMAHGRKVISLALQGGGSHGAFTWGVLDRLLEDDRVSIEAVTGASAGAMNAAVFAHGFTVGGRSGAREALDTFWESVASNTSIPWHTSVYEGSTTESNPAVESLLFLTRFFSPHQLNPFNANPLRDILSAQIDFENLRANCKIKMFIAATNVSTGMARLFTTKEISADVLLASSAIPSVHHTVEIDGKAYWDGGLTANPPIRPLVYHCVGSDILAVLLHPAHRSLPVTADEIRVRFNEISFSSAFFAELQGIEIAMREARRHPLSLGRLERRLRRLTVHSLFAPESVRQMSTLSRLNTNADFLRMLRDEGRKSADGWLREHLALVRKPFHFSFPKLRTSTSTT
jgi:NTE family protein